MRGIEALLLAGFVGLLAVGAWNARRWLPEWVPKTFTSASTDTSKGPDKFGKQIDKAKQGSGKRRAARGRQDSASADIAPGDFPKSRTDVDLPPSKFPSRKDIPLGGTGVQIRAEYGEPNARVTEIRSGRVFELYYYFNSDRTQLTVATLESGVVVSAESTLP